MRVLQVVHSLGMGGVETWLMELLRFWHVQGRNAPQMDFIATSGHRDHFDDEVQRFGSRIFYLRFGRAHLPTFVRGWRDLLQRGEYAAIHDHQEFVSGWHFLAGLGHLPPVRIAHVHNPTLGYKFNYGLTPARQLSAKAGWRLVDRLATHVCGTSAKILRDNGYEPGQPKSPRVSVVHCGFDVAKFSGSREPARTCVLEEFGWPTTCKIVLSVGRIDRALQFDHPQNHKNTWFAINVVRKVAEADPSVRYLIAGTDGARAEMEARIEEWGLADRLRFIGLRDDVPRLMRAADCLLFPSVEEGLGMVAVEAQAAGLPVLASAAVPDECIVVSKLYHAVSLREPLEHWAKTLVEILAMPRLCVEACRRGLERSDFSIVNSARRLGEIYGSGGP